MIIETANKIINKQGKSVICFVLMLLFDIGKVCRKNIHPKNKYFFASFNNDRGLSLEDKTKDYVEEIPSIYILNIFVT